MPPFPLIRPAFFVAMMASVLSLVFAVSVARAQVTDLRLPPASIHADYVSCLYAADNDPLFGLVKAQGWLETLRSAAPVDQAEVLFAEHCVANSLYLAERFDEAGKLLERLAERQVVTGDDALLDLLIQSGQAYFLAEDYVSAMEVQRRAIFYRPWDPDLHVDLAYVRQALGDNVGVVDDLSTAIKLDPERPEFRVLRASANRVIQAYDDAIQELNTVIVRWPGYPAALLERGIVKRLQGNILDAEADWLLVVRLAPDSAAAQVALENLANL